MNQTEIQVILVEHQKWLSNNGGKQANLQQADLRQANLQQANLRQANLWQADLRLANLWKANLWLANLWQADLRLANLQQADLQLANLWQADLRLADLRQANLQQADLQQANLWQADLRLADLRLANLWKANLRDADLQLADLRLANLQQATNINRNVCDPLTILLDQVGKIRAYKIVNADLEGIYNGGLKYEIGTTLTVDDANTDDRIQCAVGINLATLGWCCREWRPGYKILVCEFTRADIASIPIGGDGKFRVRQCTVIGEKNLVKLGLVKTEET